MINVDQLQTEIEMLEEVLCAMKRFKDDDAFSYSYLACVLQSKKERLDAAKEHFEKSVICMFQD